MSISNYNLAAEYENYSLIKHAENIEHKEIENQNLKVLYALQEQINQQLCLKNNTNIAELDIKTNIFSSGLLNFLIAATALETFSTSFIFGLSILSLIPTISQPVLLSSTIVFAALDTFIACSFQMSYLAQCMGIKSTSGILKHIDTYMTQLEILNDICTQLQHRSWKYNEADYKKLLAIFDEMLKDLDKNTVHIISYQPSEFLNNMKYFITLFGVASTIASSYFMSKLIIESLAGPLGHAIAQNWATLFIIIIVLANVSAYLLTTHYSLSNLFEPGLEKVTKFNDTYRLFKINHENLTSTLSKDLDNNIHL